MTAPPDRPAASPARLKRSQVSLFGGIACGIGVLILYVLLAGGPSPVNLAVGLVIGGALATWVRLADL
jgi:hypothetical protein